MLEAMVRRVDRVLSGQVVKNELSSLTAFGACSEEDRMRLAHGEGSDFEGVAD